MEEAQIKRGPGRPRKNPVMEREPQRDPSVNPLKMRAKPNWETMDMDALDTPDRLSVPPHLIPEGMALQWVTSTVYGQAMTQHRADFERRGWTPVHQEDFNGMLDGMFMAKGQDGEITVDGLVLMARPKELNIKAHQRDQNNARREVQLKEQALRGGDIPNVSLDTTHSTAINSNRLGKSVERIEVPKE